jgi:hypothetical protein
MRASHALGGIHQGTDKDVLEDGAGAWYLARSGGDTTASESRSADELQPCCRQAALSHSALPSVATASESRSAPPSAWPPVQRKVRLSVPRAHDAVRVLRMNKVSPHQLPGTYRGRTGPIGQHAIRPWPVAAEACRGLLPDPHHGTPLAPRHPTTKMGGGREGAAPALNALQTREAHRRFSCGRKRKPPSFD